MALGLGLTSFGGPIAHLGYFERTYVARRRWLSPEDYASLVAICQMLPGPASSQVSVLIGLRRAGWTGALAAWLGFTLPSACVMFAFARVAPRLAGPLAEAGLHGLRLVAVAVVAQAVSTMGRRLCPDLLRTALALAAASLMLLFTGGVTQVLVLALGALCGAVFCGGAVDAPSPPAMAIGRRSGLLAGALFMTLLFGLPLAAAAAPRSLLAEGAIFYEAGALVFGGGHVVLPLLRDALVPGWAADGAFLAGYGAAQALPGPLFTFAAYLGAVIAPHGAGPLGGALWSATALIFIFLPGMLAAVACLPLWAWMGRHRRARGGLAGVNAAVVGVLGAALYTPVWTSAVMGPRDAAMALIAFMLLERWRAAPVLVVLTCVGGELALALVR